MPDLYPRATDPETSKRLARGLAHPGTTVLAHGQWYRVLAAHVADDGGLNLEVEQREPVNVRLLDLGAAFGVILHLREPEQPQRVTFTVARSRLAAEAWAHSQGDTGWSEWRGSNGYEPWHYVWQPVVQLRGRDARTMRVVLVDLEETELDETWQYELAVLAGMGALVEVHRDLSRAGDVDPAHRWSAHLAFARVPVPSQEQS